MFIFGHKNPDTDSITSAIALSNLKNKLGYNAIACSLGNINKETKYVLDYFNVNKPILLDNVKTQVKDLDYDKVESITKYRSILFSYRKMEANNIRTLPVVDDNKRIIGIVTMKDIAMSLIKGNYYKLDTSLDNILKDLDGKLLIGQNKEINGNIVVISLYHKTLRRESVLDGNSVVIVGDMYEAISTAIESKVQLIILTGGKKIPAKYLAAAKQNNVSIISVNTDTYTASKLINQCNYISTIMKTDNLSSFYENEYLEDVKEELVTNRHSYYPVLDKKGRYLGVLNRLHVLKPNRKKVILVDHNEITQSISGLNEAQILEIVDHHKIGDIKTDEPINFRNMPLGSTCTIVYYMYKEENIEIDKATAGLLISGILSDTLYFKSPTTTEKDKNAVADLNNILNLDLDKYSYDMFKAGTSLENESIEEIFNKDFKEFDEGEYRVGVSQVFTLDIDDVFRRKDDFISYINEINKNRNHYITLLLITDILKNGSYILYKIQNDSILKRAFDIVPSQGVFIDGVVSRKKQVVPKILAEIKDN